MTKQEGPKSPAQVKQELLEEMERVASELLEWQRMNPGSDFGAMEQQLLEWRKQLGERLTEGLLEIQGQRRPVDAQCAQCGGGLSYKYMQGMWIVSRLGTVQVERAYYYCAACQQGHVPLDEQLGLLTKHLSPGVVEQLTWLNGHTATYGESVQILEQLTGVQVSKSTGWRVVQEYGARLGAQIAAEAEQIKAQAREWRVPARGKAERRRMGVSADGGMIYIRGEGWKELKIGTLFEVEMQPERDSGTGDIESYGHAVRCSYVGHLGGPEKLGEQLWIEAQRRGWPLAQEGLVIGDGAAWIWGLRDEHFPATHMLVDWYHAVEHLERAKQIAFPEGDVAASRWINSAKQTLYQGHARRVARSIQRLIQHCPQHAPALETEAHYFNTHHRRMHYHELRTDGWPIGSGMTESAVKRTAARFKGAGMRWSRPGAENLLPVRLAVLSGAARFTELWQRVLAAHISP